ncbi:hypothetical protein AJ79_09202 [Helicocarpus griseus UAMH5409]|uniref:FAD-binding domain-containing protein n=1 Tax=Helicocarpus griseus UAMH5409 TaxID=1447875 RepID=A0A2B7WLQ1_9EURO|nr:hypothetical protein AJ79_09202 [Helicocarpus griseus UAMH5409]
MEETTVLIVGAGPSGLALGALLARMNIKAKVEVCEDPRGIVVNGDAVRISYQLGIGEGLTKRIGKVADIGVLNFHRGNFRQPIFMAFDITVDWAEQAVSNNLTQFQPNYEREIRNLIAQFPNCEIRTGCEAVAREEKDDHTILEYVTQNGTKRHIRTSWLVGADGKRGVVRKRFLEPEGIRQEDGFYTYVGTWVAANLHITTPTPQSHPQFPLWQLGYTPQQVHDAFWPSGFHFCNSSKRPAVSGRFGPPNSGFWRHEFSVEPEDKLEDIEGDFWKQFGSWMIIPGSKFSRKLRKIAVEFPRDCIQIVRCRPFTFATKVINRWYCRKTMLIGDAAHVFPPFGGQGIAAGIRDAQALSWRLALMSNLNASPQIRERILTGWSQERRHAWNAATLATRLNGSIVNQRSFLGGLIYRTCMRILWWFPSIARFRTQRAFRDKLVYNETTCPDGFFLEKAGGGRKVAQIFVRRHGEGERATLSDGVFLRHLPRMGLLILVRGQEDGDPKFVDEVLSLANAPEHIIAPEDVTFFCINEQAGESLVKLGAGKRTYYPCSEKELLEQGITPIKGYRETSVQDRFDRAVKFVLIRPDFFVHSVAADAGELKENLEKVKEYFS